MRYSYVPQSEAAHEADVTRCPHCHSTHTPEVVEAPPPPLVRARPPAGPQEIADGRGQAMYVGRLARARGWLVYPTYYQAHDGSEVSLLSMRRDDLRAVASWQRPRGGAWSSDVAYGWRHEMPGTMTKLGVRRLVEHLKRLGAPQ